uniref:NADH dehydrogenase subunit 2 n=1 Tax=Cyphonia clavata TaxID=104817 RepID=UPI0022FD85B7|nr:NADH dehydrogenase subunit 2 [Cyphonia clavata]WAP90797.1 NADH dehydrogenase subunit 2 [Cyphonia clavata]
MSLNFNKKMFMMFMVMGITISLCSNNWMSMWLGMEISLMTFLPMMSSKLKTTSESCMKYYIIQSLSSSIMMMGIIMMSMKINSEMLITMAILMKLGMTPFHSWMISIMEGMSYQIMTLLFTLMKLAPMNMISWMNVNLQIPVMLGMMISSLSALNQNSLKKILCYSSIYNMSLMLTSNQMWNIWMSFMTMYSMMTMIVMKILSEKNINFVNQMMIKNEKKMMKTEMWIMILMMGGLPPSTSFLLKIMVIQNLMQYKQYMMIVIIILTSCLSMFFYMRISTLSMSSYMSTPKWMFKKESETKMKFIITLTVMFPMLSYMKIMT